MSACDDKLLLLHALVDGELDAANALVLEAHLEACPGCRAELERIRAVRGMLAAASLGAAAPPALRDRIDAMLAAESGGTAAARPPPFGRPVTLGRARRLRGGLAAAAMRQGKGRSWGAGFAAGLACSAALVLALPQFTRVGTEDQLVANHVRSLSLGSHLTDIATSDRHVVKPWFNGKVDFAPRVPELAAQGFPLVGGRLDVVDGHEVAAIVYRRRLHSINVFVRPAPTLALPVDIASRHEGYSIVRWSDGGLEYWGVSDIDPGELKLFARAFLRQPSL